MFETYRKELMVVLAGLVLVGGGVFWFKSGQSSQSSVEIVKEDTNVTKANESTPKLVIDVEGAVVKPGIYTMDKESRIDDALNVAGGLTADADIDWVKQNINRAGKINDGQKIFIPKAGEQKNGRVEVKGVSAVNINTASQGELEGLPGIGPVTAGKIIAGRPYQSGEELMSRKIVGQRVFDQIKEKISVW